MLNILESLYCTVIVFEIIYSWLKWNNKNVIVRVSFNHEIIRMSIWHPSNLYTFPVHNTLELDDWISIDLPDIDGALSIKQLRLKFHALFQRRLKTPFSQLTQVWLSQKMAGDIISWYFVINWGPVTEPHSQTRSCSYENFKCGPWGWMPHRSQTSWKILNSTSFNRGIEHCWWPGIVGVPNISDHERETINSLVTFSGRHFYSAMYSFYSKTRRGTHELNSANRHCSETL